MRVNYVPALLPSEKKQGPKVFRPTSTSHKAIKDTSSALRWSPIQVLMLLLNFSDETGTRHAMPQFMKILRPLPPPKKKKRKAKTRKK